MEFLWIRWNLFQNFEHFIIFSKILTEIFWICNKVYFFLSKLSKIITCNLTTYTFFKMLYLCKSDLNGIREKNKHWFYIFISHLWNSTVFAKFLNSHKGIFMTSFSLEKWTFLFRVTDKFSLEGRSIKCAWKALYQESIFGSQL